MTLNERIEKEYVQAYKARDAVRLGVLRLLKTAARNRLVELCRTDGTLADDELMDVIIRQAKQRQDSIEQYNAANRPDLAAREEGELAILREYLPQMLYEAALAQAIDDAIASTGATGPGDMGRVIGLVMGANKGRVDGKAVSAEVKKRLCAKG